MVLQTHKCSSVSATTCVSVFTKSCASISIKFEFNWIRVSHHVEEDEGGLARFVPRVTLVDQKKLGESLQPIDPEDELHFRGFEVVWTAERSDEGQVNVI